LTTFTSEDRENAVKKITPAVEVVDSAKIVREAPYHPGYEDAVINPDAGRNLSEVIREQMKLEASVFGLETTSVNTSLMRRPNII
jgi:hypothetical protein